MRRTASAPVLIALTAVLPANSAEPSTPPDVVATFSIVGYDPDVFAYMGFAAPQHDPKDDRRFRSHLSVIVSRLVNKLVTIPVLKDHRSAGVTLTLKNLSHGMYNNVARRHLSGIPRGDKVSGPN